MVRKISSKQLQRLKKEPGRYTEAEWLKILGAERGDFLKMLKKLKLSPRSLKPGRSASKAESYVIEPFNLSNRMLAIALTMSLGLLAVYLKCLTPLVGAGDAAEFSTAGLTLGVAHFPGYHLWTLMGNVFSRLPLGFVAYRLNLMASLMGAVALIFVFLLLAELVHPYLGKITRQNHLLSLAITLLLAFTPAYLAVCVEADVYSFNLLFISLLCWLTWHYRAKLTSSGLFLIALICGLGLSNHYYLLLVFPALFYSLYTAKRTLFNKKGVLWCLFFVFLGWSLYPLYIPIRAVKEPLLNWSAASNFSSFLNHITLSSWSETQEVGAAHNFSWLMNQLKFLGLIFYSQLGLFLFIPLASLTYQFYKGQKDWLRFSLLFLLFSLIVPVYVLNYQTSLRAVNLGAKFYLPVYLILLLITGISLAAFARRHMTGVKSGFKINLLITFLFLIAAAHGVTSVNRESRRTYFAPYDLGQNLLNTLPQASVIFSQGFHQTNSLLFFASVLNAREDVKYIDRYGNVFPLIYPRSTTPMKEKAEIEKMLIDGFTKRGRAVFYSLNDSRNLGGRSFKPTGLLYRYRTNNLTSPWPGYVKRGLGEIGTDNYLGSAIASEYLFHKGEAFRELGDIELAASCYEKAAAVGERLEWVGQEAVRPLLAAKREDLAIPIYQKIVGRNPTAGNNYLLGSAFILANRPGEAIPFLSKALSLDADRIEYSFSLGLALQRNKQAGEAAKVFHRLKQSSPNFLPARFQLAATYEQINPAQAASYWREYLKSARNVPGEADRVVQAKRRLQALDRR